MKKILFSLFALLVFTFSKAQTPDIYHGVNAAVNNNLYLYDYYYGNGNNITISPSAGYFLDVHMRGRTWLFMQFNAVWTHKKETNTYTYWNPPYEQITYTDTDNFLDINIPIRFAFRLGKEDGKFTFFPTAGFGVYLPMLYASKRVSSKYGTSSDVEYAGEYDVPFYPLLNIGFEAKWRINEKHNMGFGFNSDYLLAQNSIYVKFGWNKYPKAKKKE